MYKMIKWRTGNSLHVLAEYLKKLRVNRVSARRDFYF